MSIEYNLCPKCGGVKLPVAARGKSIFRPCMCKAEPVPPGRAETPEQKRAVVEQRYAIQRLDIRNDATVQIGTYYPGEEGIYISTPEESGYLDGKQALALLDWLTQHKGELEEMGICSAKEAYEALLNKEVKQ